MSELKETHATGERSGDDGESVLRELRRGERAEPAVDLVERGAQARLRSALFGAPQTPLAIGRFVYLRALGEGAAGVVVAAYDPLLRREVAIKLLRHSSDDDGSGSSRHAELRMRREAEALAQLSHPNVVQVHEVGEHDGQHFIAMESIKGTDLARWLVAAPRTSREILEVFMQAGAGLAAAHACALIHRDFKPTNVLVGDDGRVCVADFGLVRAGVRGDAATHSDTPSQNSSAEDPAMPVTREGARVGTPGYMAPEQLEGKTADAKSDQFSFCASLYEGLYGVRPFSGSTFPALLAAIRSQTLSKPRTQAPTWLRSTILRGLSADPSARFGDMDELLAALANDPTHRRRGWMLLGGLAALLVATGTTRAVQQSELRAECEDAGDSIAAVWSDSRRHATEAAMLSTGTNFAETTVERVNVGLEAYISGWRGLRSQTCIATRLDGTRSTQLHDLSVACLEQRRADLEALVEVLGTPDVDVVRNATSAVRSLPQLAVCEDDGWLLNRPTATNPEDPNAAYELLRKLAEAKALTSAGSYAPAQRKAQDAVVLATRLGDDANRARALLQRGATQHRLGDDDEATLSLTAAFHLAGGLGHDAVAVRAANLLVQVAAVQVRYADGVAWGEHSAMLITRAGLEGGLLSAERRYNMARLYLGDSKHDLALDQYQAALSIWEGILGPDHPTVAHALDGVGRAYNTVGKHREAIDYLERSRSILIQALGPSHPEVAAATRSLGLALANAGEYEQARHHYERARELYERALGPRHSDVAAALVGIAGVHVRQANLDEAQRTYERALDIQQETLGPRHPATAGTTSKLAQVHEMRGEYKLALEQHRRALAMLEEIWAPDHTSLVSPLSSMSIVHLKQGDYKQAIATTLRALSIVEGAAEVNRPRVAGLLTNLGAAYSRDGNDEEALACFERALAIKEETLGPQHSEVGSSLHNLGLFHRLHNDNVAARGYFQRALQVREHAMGPEHPALAYPLVGLGAIAAEEGDLRKAVELLERASKIREAHDVDPRERAMVHLVLAKALRSSGDQAGARRRAQQAVEEFARAGRGNEAKLADARKLLETLPNAPR